MDIILSSLSFLFAFSVPFSHLYKWGRVGCYLLPKFYGKNWIVLLSHKDRSFSLTNFYYGKWMMLINLAIPIFCWPYAAQVLAKIALLLSYLNKEIPKSICLNSTKSASCYSHRDRHKEKKNWTTKGSFKQWRERVIQKFRPKPFCNT